MKKFIIEIDDENWDKVIKEMKARYSISNPQFLTTDPPTDAQMFEDYMYTLWADFNVEDMADFDVKDIAGMIKRDIISLVLTPPSPYSTAILPFQFQKSIKGGQEAGNGGDGSSIPIPLGDRL